MATNAPSGLLTTELWSGQTSHRQFLQLSQEEAPFSKGLSMAGQGSGRSEREYFSNHRSQDWESIGFQRILNFQVETLAESNLWDLEARMHQETGLTGCIAAIHCNIIQGNGRVHVDYKPCERILLVFTAMAGDGQVIHVEAVWKTRPVALAFQQTKLFAWLKKTRFPVFQ